MKRSFLLGTLAASLVASPALAQGTMTGPNGDFEVGVSASGTIYNGGIGFRRTGDGVDPILPGTPREAWGVSAGNVGGLADPMNAGGVYGLDITSPFSTATNSLTAYLTDGGSQLLRLDFGYSFDAANVLRIATTITNVSGAAQSVLFSRNVDWDLAPNAMSEIIHTDAYPTGPVTNATFYGFESANPLDGFGAQAAQSGGTYGPDDLGGGFIVNLGTMAAGASASFNIFHAMNTTTWNQGALTGQNEAALRTQVAGLGATYMISGVSSHAGENSMVLGYGPATVTATPEPASVALMATGLLALGGVAARRRSRRA